MQVPNYLWHRSNAEIYFPGLTRLDILKSSAIFYFSAKFLFIKIIKIKKNKSIGLRNNSK